MPTHAEKRIIPLPKELLFKVVSDVEAYPKFLPWIQDVSTFQVEDQSFLSVVKIGYQVFSHSYRCRVNLTPFERIDIEYISGPFKHLNNHWIFSSLEGGTEVDFYIDFALEHSLLQGMLESVFSKAVSMMVNAFEERAKQIAKEG